MTRLFKKMFLGAFVAVKSKFALRKLSAKKYDIPPQQLIEGKLDTTKWGLPPGVYHITVTAHAEGLESSIHSNEITLTIK